MRHLIEPPDLGDILGVRVGDPLAVLHVEKGRAVVRTGVVEVRAVEDARVLVGRGGKSVGGFLKKNGGGCAYFMQSPDVAGYYYSANPAHITEARRLKAAEDAKATAARANLERLRRMAEPVGVLLGDGERHDNYGDSYESAEARDTIVEKLSEEQIHTLRGWFGLPPFEEQHT